MNEMNPISQQIETHNPSEGSQKKSKVRMFFFGVFLALLIGVVGIGSYMMGADKSDKTFPVDAQETSSNATFNREIPSKASPTPTATKTNEYVMEEVGLSFTLPEGIKAGDFVKEVKAPSNPISSGRLFCAELLESNASPHIDTACSLQERALLVIGGTSPDYYDERDSYMTDFQGFIFQDEKYLARFWGPENFSDVTEIAKPFFNKNNVEIIKISGFPNDTTTWPKPGQMAAIINTKDETFKGVSLLVNLDQIDEATFDQILSTFKFIQ